MTPSLRVAVPPPSPLPVLVLLHGFTGSPAAWDPIVSRLEKRFRVFRPWLPGHHPDDQDCATFGEASAMLATLLASLPSPRTILGYSLGGRLALYTTVHHPQVVDTVILESATAGIEDAAERAIRKQADDVLARQIRERGVGWFADYWAGIPLFASHQHLPASTRAAQQEERRAHSAEGLACSLEQMGAGVMEPMWDQLRGLEQPVRLITGTLDERYTALAIRMQGQLRNARHRLVSNAGHTPHLENPSEFVRAIHH